MQKRNGVQHEKQRQVGPRLARNARLAARTVGRTVEQ